MELDRKAQTIERRRATRATPQYRRVAPPPPARTLKESLGNHAVQRFIARLQRKPTVSAPDDPLERQADVVADRVMRTSTQDLSPAKRGVLQPKGQTATNAKVTALAPCDGCYADMPCSACAGEETISRKETAGAGSDAPAVPHTL